ncbi:hypothetical protein HGM15179_006101 [Zosterops borbonicus]|uniref:Rna-directed dna polymerase from mobile element jockey-like n=1 Tax=Zosterops borbonicus TaxID=364589 RepID=A0A8K1GP27_9PASS|nr:hypothetical protein HGM15179_006101 [Zosterops borbonicus]
MGGFGCSPQPGALSALTTTSGGLWCSKPGPVTLPRDKGHGLEQQPLLPPLGPGKAPLWCPQGSGLGPALVKVFFNVSSLGKFMMTPVWGSVDVLKGRKDLEKDLDRLDPWAKDNGVRVNKVKCQILHLGHNNPIGCSRLEPGKGPEGAVTVPGHKPRCAQVAKRPRTPGLCQPWGGSRSRAVPVPCAGTAGAPPGLGQLWDPPGKRDLEGLERVQGRERSWGRGCSPRRG